jgi:acid phosphatase (class A)
MRKLALAALLCLAATPAFSLSDQPYMAPNAVDFALLVPPPPAESSERGKLDDQFILDAQKNMTAQKMADIQRDFIQNVFVVGQPVLGDKFSKENMPMTDAFFAKVIKEAGAGVGPLKRKYKKIRPFQYDKNIHTPENIASKSMGPTYPSGHSTTGAISAILLSQMVPEKRDALYERGWEYGINRVMSGAAYPSDWDAAHMIAELAINQMMKDPGFQADFQQVKAEVRKGLGLP